MKMHWKGLLTKRKLNNYECRFINIFFFLSASRILPIRIRPLLSIP